jgi:hypothetical protein
LTPRRRKLNFQRTSQISPTADLSTHLHVYLRASVDSLYIVSFFSDVNNYF